MLTSTLRSGSRLSAPAAIPPGGRGNSHPSIPDHGPVSPEFQNSILNDAADKTVVMIGVGGGVSLPFLFFHAAPIGEQISSSQAPVKRCP